MTVAVTGGAGYVGTNLAAALRGDGHEVRVVDLVRPVTALRHGARWVRADVRDEAAMRAALSGVDIVYHLAAVISVVGGLGGLVESVNVGGVRAVGRAALAAGVRRFVHCSSVHTFDVAASAGGLVDEGSRRAVPGELPAYDRSKAAGEEELGWLAAGGLDTVTINPTGIIGPEDEGPSRMGAVLLALWRQRGGLSGGGAPVDGYHLLPTVEALHALAAVPVVDGRKAAEELGYRPRPIADTLADLHASFARHGQLRRPARATHAPDS
jgi:nucleoside-diphosphate-sugar epimerase